MWSRKTRSGFWRVLDMKNQGEEDGQCGRFLVWKTQPSKKRNLQGRRGSGTRFLHPAGRLLRNCENTAEILQSGMSAQPQARTVTRKELYDLVWKTPIRKLAVDFGVSNVAVAKACKRLNVPRPPRGYWAKLAFGKKIQKPKLPQSATGAPSSTVIDPANSIVSPKTENVCAETMQIINVPEDLHGCHPLVSATKKSLESDKPGVDLLLRSAEKGTLSIMTSRNSMHRALSLMEALIRAAEANGWKVEGKEDRGGMKIIVGEDGVSLEMVEKIDQTEIVPRPTGANWWKRYTYSPSGRFTIRITEYLEKGARQSWSDGKTQRLNTLLSEVLAGISSAAEQLRKRRLEREEWHRKCEEQKRIREELAARIKNEKERRSRLTEEVAGWNRAHEIRRFCDEIETYISKEPDRFPKGDVKRWLIWAREIAAKYDPFENGYVDQAILDKGLEASLDCSQKISPW